MQASEVWGEECNRTVVWFIEIQVEIVLEEISIPQFFTISKELDCSLVCNLQSGGEKLLTVSTAFYQRFLKVKLTYILGGGKLEKC